MTRRIAIIPARGGSKRISHKNIRDFCGKPMIAHILETASKSRLFEVVHVSTEDLLIRDTVESLGFPIDFLRPDSLADDFTGIMPVLKYVVETYSARGQEFDEVWLLMACAPLIDPDDLTAAARLSAGSGGLRPVLAIAPYSVPIEWAFRRDDDGSLTPIQPGMFATRSQDFEPKYFDSGTFAVFPVDRVRSSEGPGSDIGYVGYELARHKAIDIDDESDWSLAEAIFEQKKLPDADGLSGFATPCPR